MADVWSKQDLASIHHNPCKGCGWFLAHKTGCRLSGTGPYGIYKRRSEVSALAAASVIAALLKQRAYVQG